MNFSVGETVEIIKTGTKAKITNIFFRGISTYYTLDDSKDLYNNADIRPVHVFMNGDNFNIFLNNLENGLIFGIKDIQTEIGTRVQIQEDKIVDFITLLEKMLGLVRYRKPSLGNVDMKKIDELCEKIDREEDVWINIDTMKITNSSKGRAVWPFCGKDLEVVTSLANYYHNKYEHSDSE